MNFLNGYKTKLGGFGMILTGVAGLIFHFVDNTNTMALGLPEAIALIGNGLGILGLGHKIQKK